MINIQKFIDTPKKSWVTKVATDALKTTSKRAIQNTLEAIGDLIGNKIADKITNTSSENVPETNSINRFNSTLQTEGAIPKEIYILPKIIVYNIKKY